MKVLITGANGFIGNGLTTCLGRDGVDYIGAVRSISQNTPPNTVNIGEVSRDTDWSSVLENIQVVIHTANLAHGKQAIKGDARHAFREFNVKGTLQLARQAIYSGVKRFIFISSINVYGPFCNNPFSATDIPAPVEFEAMAKLDTEFALRELCEGANMEFVIVRAPLVYGPNVPGNFGDLLRLANSTPLLPLGAVKNSRSLVALDNLIDLIVTCIDHPKAANHIFLVSDDDDVSTTELLKRIGDAFELKAWLLPIPKWMMMLAASLVGKKTAVDRLFGSLLVDISHTKKTLGWKPSVTMQEQLRKIAASYKL